MIDFETVWKFTDTIPGSFTYLNGMKLYEQAIAVPTKGRIVEVGVDQGRSASILMATAQYTGARITLVDSWESVLIDNYAKVKALRWRFDCIVQIVNKFSVEAAAEFYDPIDLLHIDANHYDDNPGNDCKSWLPKLRQGGVVCFHDVYATFPAVTEAVDTYTAGWEDLGTWESLAIRRKQ